MRRALDLAVVFFSAICAAICLGIVLLIIAALVFRGGRAFSWQFLTEGIQLAGAGGGIFYNILGTVILLASALIVSVPLATAIGVLHGVYLRSPRSRARLWLWLSILNGLPSILFGLFGMMIFVRFFGWGKSWLTGGILLGMMMLPTVTVAFIVRLQALPRKYAEAAAGLGLRPSQIVWSVLLPQSAPGLVTGALLGLARAAGETAPILFTATIFSGATLPTGIKESPVLTLPYHIFVLSQDSFDPAAAENVWAAALVLLSLTLGLSLAALPARLKLHEEAHHG